MTRPYVPSDSSFEDRLNIFTDDFIDNVKRSLWSHMNSDPAFKFEVKGHKDVFDYITSLCQQVGKQKFQPKCLKDLDCVFGK